MLASGLSAIEESAVTLPIIIYLVFLASNNSLTRFLNQLTNGTGYTGGIPALLQDPAYSIGLIILIGSILSAVLLIGIVGGGFVLSAEYGTYLQAWTTNSVPVGAVLENGRKNWKRAAWTRLLTDLLTWGPVLAGIALFFLLVSGINAATPLTTAFFLVILYSLIPIVLGIVSLIISIFTVYSIPAAIIDQTSGLGAIGKSFRFVANNFWTTLTYIVVRFIFQFLSVLLIILASIIGLPLSSLGTVVLSLLLTPILHSTKAMIYSYGRSTEAEMPFEVFEPIWRDIGLRLPRAAWRKMRIGLSEISHFLLSPRNLPFHILATLSLVLGIWLGDYVSTNGLVSFLGIQPGTINPAVVQSFGPVLGIYIFLNNWLVSIATGLSGIGFGIPAFQTILFNGFIVGLIIPAFQNLTLLLAGLLPHGTIEIPSLVLSGSIGLKLGWAALRAKFDPTPENRDFLSLTLRQTVYIVVGLAPLFVIAGTIEGNVTPIIMRWFGWTG